MLVGITAVFRGEALEAVSWCAGGPWRREGKAEVEGRGREEKKKKNSTNYLLSLPLGLTQGRDELGEWLLH